MNGKVTADCCGILLRSSVALCYNTFAIQVTTLRQTEFVLALQKAKLQEFLTIQMFICIKDEENEIILSLFLQNHV